MRCGVVWSCLMAVAVCGLASAAEPFDGGFQWKSTAPLVSPVDRPSDPCISVKDPSLVRYGDQWHLFCTIRSERRTHQIEYLKFADWSQANAAPRQVLKISDGYYCAPQVFYFRPRKTWCLICQVAHPGGKPTIMPACSTTETLDQPGSWSAPRLMFDDKPEHVSSWIDFWVICDESRAHLFFTSNDGRMWRSDAPLDEFPRGWNHPQVVLSGDIFEASHTYRLQGRNEFLTVIEAQGERGRRYYKAYLADGLEQDWRPLAATSEHPFASPANVAGENSWTTSYSHGELVRAGFDERLEIDPQHLQFLYQGVDDEHREGRPYGQIPWRLGLLTCE